MRKASIVATLEQVVIRVKIMFKCSLVLVWKQGAREVASRQYSLSDGVASLEQAMQLRLRERGPAKTTLSLVIRARAGEKLAGVANLTVHESSEGRHQLKLDHCPDTNAHLSFVLSVRGSADPFLGSDNEDEAVMYYLPAKFDNIQQFSKIDSRTNSPSSRLRSHSRLSSEEKGMTSRQTSRHLIEEVRKADSPRESRPETLQVRVESVNLQERMILLQKSRQKQRYSQSRIKLQERKNPASQSRETARQNSEDELEQLRRRNQHLQSSLQSIKVFHQRQMAEFESLKYLQSLWIRFQLHAAGSFGLSDVKSEHSLEDYFAAVKQLQDLRAQQVRINEEARAQFESQSYQRNNLIRDLRDKLAEGYTKIQAMQREKTKHQTKWAGLEAELRLSIQDLTQQLRAVRLEKDQLGLSLARLQVEKSNIHTQLASIQTEKSRLELGAKDTAALLKRLQQSESQFKASQQHKKIQLQTLRQQFLKCTEQKRLLQCELGAKTQQIKAQKLTMLEELKMLAAEIANHKAKNQHLVAEKSVLAKEKDRALTEMEQLRSRIEVLGKEKDTLAKQNSSLNGLNAELKQGIQMLEERIGEMQAAASQQQPDDRLRAQLQNKQKQLCSLRAQLSDTQQQKSTFENEANSEYFALLNKYQATKSQLELVARQTRQLDFLRNELSEREKKLSALTTANRKLNQQISASGRQILIQGEPEVLEVAEGKVSVQQVNVRSIIIEEDNQSQSEKGRPEGGADSTVFNDEARYNNLMELHRAKQAQLLELEAYVLRLQNEHRASLQAKEKQLANVKSDLAKLSQAGHHFDSLHLTQLNQKLRRVETQKQVLSRQIQVIRKQQLDYKSAFQRGKKQLEADIARLKQQLNQARTRAAGMERQLLAKLKAAENQMTTQQRALGEERQRLCAKLQQSQKRRQLIQQELLASSRDGSKQREIANLKSRVEEMAKQIDTYAESNNALQQELDLFKEKNRRAAGELQNMAAARNRENSAARAGQQQLVEKIQQLSDRCTQLEEALESERTILQKHMVDCKANTQRKDRQLKQAVDARNQLAEQLRVQSETVVRRLGQEEAQLRHNGDRLRKECQRLSRQLSAKARECLSLSQTKSNLQAEVLRMAEGYDQQGCRLMDLQFRLMDLYTKMCDTCQGVHQRISI